MAALSLVGHVLQVPQEALLACAAAACRHVHKRFLGQYSRAIFLVASFLIVIKLFVIAFGR